GDQPSHPRTSGRTRTQDRRAGGVADRRAGRRFQLRRQQAFHSAGRHPRGGPRSLPPAGIYSAQHAAVAAGDLPDPVLVIDRRRQGGLDTPHHVLVSDLPPRPFDEQGIEDEGERPPPLRDAAPAPPSPPRVCRLALLPTPRVPRELGTIRTACRPVLTPGRSPGPIVACLFDSHHLTSVSRDPRRTSRRSRGAAMAERARTPR